MKTEWDYTELADAYLKRPDYSEKAIDDMVAMASLKKGSDVCDIGAGVAHLTLALAKRGFRVTAVEPNDAMRANGRVRTRQFSNVEWYEGTGEQTGRAPNTYDMVTFGSSFNVTDRPVAMRETCRILKPRGWFACMWNHRDLEDPIQAEIERIIGSHVANYGYGTRREDQTEVINSSGLFEPCTQLEGQVQHYQSKADCVEAWRSHATLHRQAGDKFPSVIRDIEAYLAAVESSEIRIPYTTRIWVARRKD